MMEFVTFENGIMNYRNCLLWVRNSEVLGDACLINVFNEDNDFIITLVANETTINGVIQTSAQMIIDTLSNGQS
jgi:hypothetical protein